ncbi:SPARC-like [Lytechinus variegatus]|uniref:SPARC-like n=1 Tax=Lytechinus variegatus TaxID=7654 RepID=UPI001BB2BE2D|nr:SPARC-like [Lytechinus variegatus]
MMKILIVLCLASLACANEHERLADQELANAKIALDELTYTKQELIYNVMGHDGERETGYENEVEDPCANFECSIGRECTIDEFREPFCVCAESCPQEENSNDAIHRTKVCATNNVTYTNLCEFHRRKCEDTNSELKRIDVDYYGECAEMGECSSADMKEFPGRMTRWFNDSIDLIRNRAEEHGGLTQKEMEFFEEGWGEKTNVIYWKFGRLDKNPADLYLTFTELEALRAPIVLFEPCTKPFLQSCDKDEDRQISALEFGACLELKPEQIPY